MMQQTGGVSWIWTLGLYSHSRRFNDYLLLIHHGLPTATYHAKSPNRSPRLAGIVDIPATVLTTKDY